jgi:hypothetical protein
MGSKEYFKLRFLKKCRGEKNQGGRMLCRCEPVERRASKHFKKIF